MTAHISRTERPPLTLLAVAALGTAWNAFGITRFLATDLASEAELIAGGMTAAQAALYAGLPAWMSVAFAVGVFGGLAGSLLLAVAPRAAAPVLGVSLAAYLLLFAGDAALGVFAAFGAGQVVILGIVVAIAAGLTLFAARASRA